MEDVAAMQSGIERHLAIKSVPPALPSVWDAPAALLRLEAHCGVIAAWATLRYFHRRASSDAIVRACRHTARHGVFTIALACALRSFGLEVHFFTDPDSATHSIERPFYARANRLGIPVQSAADLDHLLAHIAAGHIAIVLYEDGEDAHLAILLGEADGSLFFHDGSILDRADFLRFWGTPSTLRQSVVIVGRTEAGAARGIRNFSP